MVIRSRRQSSRLPNRDGIWNKAFQFWFDSIGRFVDGCIAWPSVATKLEVGASTGPTRIASSWFRFEPILELVHGKLENTVGRSLLIIYLGGHALFIADCSIVNRRAREPL